MNSNRRPNSKGWLSASAYRRLLEDARTSSMEHSIPIHEQHPQCIYDQPTDNMMYFLSKSSFAECRFPKIQRRKRLIWKKLNFPTRVPRQQPLVEYLVATTVRSEQTWKMHIIRTMGVGEYVLCHIKLISYEESEKLDLSLAKRTLPAKQTDKDVPECRLIIDIPVPTSTAEQSALKAFLDELMRESQVEVVWVS